jgi:integrase
MPKYRRGSGSVYLKRGWCYIKYYSNGQLVTEATGTKNKAEARRLLQTRLGQVAEGRYFGPAAERVTINELIEGLLNDYEVNGKRSLKWVRIKVTKHVLPSFTGRRAHEVTTQDIQAYTKERQGAGASNAEINRELALLKRAYNLAYRAERIVKKPYIPLLQERNVRQGFFEAREFDAVLAHLPPPLRPPMTFAYYTGWRMASEILKLTWNQVDLEAGTVRLEAHTTKNDDARPIYLPQLLVDVLEQQWQEHIERYPECQYVFHRNGKPIINYRPAWLRACQEAGIQGKIPHDFRRTAVRNLVRAGVPERVAMAITGHKTRSVFERYNIVSDGDLREAARRLNNAMTTQTATTLATLPEVVSLTPGIH